MLQTNFDALPSDAIVRLSTLISWGVIPFSASTVWRKCRSGEFPAPLKISQNVTGWRVGDLRRWLAEPTAYRCGKGDAAQ